MTVAYNLGKTLGELEGMSTDELGKWIAFFKLMQELERKAQGRGK